MFALAIVPVIGFTGAAIDYSRVSTARAAMQDALDATALMLSKQAPGLTTDQINTTAQNYFNALYTNHPEATNVTVQAAYTTSGGTQLTITGAGTVPTTLTHMLGFSTMNFGTSSTVKWGSTKLRVALVLDNTGSMDQSNKLPALKTATHQLLTILQAAASSPGDVQVSIVPFSKDVNVDKANYQANWLKWSSPAGTASPDTWDENNGTCSKSGFKPKSSCVAQNVCSISGNNNQSDCTSAGTCSISGENSKSNCQSAAVCSLSQYTKQSKCTKNGGTWNVGVWTAGVWRPATWTPADHSTWNGCVMDRDQNYDVNNTSPDPGTPATLFVPEQYSACTAGAVLALGYDWNALSSAVDAMKANGSTNQTIGLAMGWQTLTGGNPYNVPALPADTRQFVILLSDGLNTQDRWYGNGSDVSTDVDTRMSTVCTNAKASGTTIYTVQVNTGNDPTSTVLRNCASDASMFYALTSSGQIVTTFQTIGTNLAKLRISR